MQIEELLGQGRTLVENILPTIRLLLAQPERDDLLLTVTGQGLKLFTLLNRNGRHLGLEHLLAPCEAMESVLESAKLGHLQLDGRHVSLLLEVCSFIDQGGTLIAQEGGSDARLAASATALQAAVMELLHSSMQSSSDTLGFVGVSSEMQEAFVQESEQLLMLAEQEFVLWDFIAIDHERVSELCRSLHRLKENFSIYDCNDFERLCMALESALNRYLQGEFFQTEYPERVFLRCIDEMREALRHFALSETLTLTHLEDLLQAVQGLIRQPLGELLIEAGLVNPKTIDDALSLQRIAPGGNARRLGEVLVGMGEVSQDDVDSVLNHQQFLQEQSEKGGGRGTEVRKEPNVSLFPSEVSVNGHRLVRIVSIVKQLAAQSLPEDIRPFIQELDQLTQNMSLGGNYGFSHYLQRVVSDLSMEYNKRVHFRVEGAAVLREELDMVEFADILIPLLRNSVEHGIEPASLRQKEQKRKHGRITLSALRQADELWVSVEDDGAGFDLNTIGRLCLEQGLVNKEEIVQMTGAELLQVFLQDQKCELMSGASNDGQCTGLAGVKKRLQNFYAKMDIWSRPGKGARVTLRIPRAS
nr:ATP-binding protein [uncultured Desulfobulbus sp.]